jgi:hypothetical protein
MIIQVTARPGPEPANASTLSTGYPDRHFDGKDVPRAIDMRLGTA